MLLIGDGIEAPIAAADNPRLAPPVRGIEQKGQRHFEHAGHLARIGRKRKAFGQHTHHGLDIEAGAGEIAGPDTRHGDEAAGNAGLLQGLAQRRLHRRQVIGFAAPAGKADLSAVLGQGLGAPCKEQGWLIARHNGQKHGSLDAVKARGPQLRRQIVIIMRMNLGRRLQKPAAHAFQQAHAGGSGGLAAGEFLLAVITPQLMDFY